MDAPPTGLASSAPRSPADAPEDAPHPSANGTPRSPNGKIPRNPTPLQRERLIAALVDALDYARMEALASFVFGRRSDLIFNPRWLLTEIALRIVERAEEQHRLIDLQARATELNPHNDLLQRWFQDTASGVSNPYRGFAAFGVDDEDVFFGRKTLVDKLAEAVGQRPVVVVTGASGSGKTSAVHAGLLPRLGLSEEWLEPVCFQPGKRPFTRLASCLVQRLEGGKSQVDQLVERDKLAAKLRDRTVTPADLLERLRGTHEATPRLLLVADQFEELFSPDVDAPERDAFLDVLLGAFSGTEERPCPTVLVVMMRADSIRRAQAHPLFAGVLGESRQNVEGMRRDDLRQVVEGPAAVRGIELTPGLSDLILEDTAEQPGNLPLLAFTMTRLAELLVVGKRDQPIALLLPQVEAALVKHADDVVVNLGEDNPHLRKIFLQLVRVAEGAAVTRVPATRDALGEETWHLVDRLADERVVVTDYDEANGVETVQLAHDTMLTNWPRLQGWIAEETVFLQWLDRLRTALREWEGHREQPDAAESLLSGPRLEFAQSWQNDERYGAILSPAQRRFIQDSMAKRDADREAETERRNRTTRRLVAGLIVALLLMAVAGWQWRVATDAKLAVENEVQTGVSRRLAVAAEEALDAQGGNPQLDLGLLLGAEGFGRRQTPEAKFALLRGLAAAPNLMTVLNETGAPTTAVDFSPDGELLAAGSSADAVQIWELATRRRLDSPAGDDLGIRSLAFSPIREDRLLAVGTLGGDVVIVQIDDALAVHERARTTGAHRDAVTSIAFASDGRTLATGSADGSIALWDSASGDAWSLTRREEQVQPTGHPNAVADVAFDGTDEVLASSGADGTIRLWNVATGELLGKPLIGHTGPVWTIAYRPRADAPLLASGGADGFITLWDPVAGTVLARHEKVHQSLAVSSLAFNADGTKLASGGLDRVINVWSVAEAAAGSTRVPSIEKTDTLTGNDVRLTSVAFEPDGQLIASGAFDGAVSIWDAGQSYVLREPVGPRLPAERAVVSPDGSTVAATTTEGSDVLLLPVHDPPSNRVLAGHAVRPQSLAFSTEGTKLVSGGADEMLIVWDAATGTEQTRCEGFESRVTSLAFADENRFASGHENGVVRLWTIDAERCREASWPDHASSITSVAFSRDGAMMASVDRAGVVIIRNVQAMPAPAPIRLDPSVLGVETTSLAFSDDGETLVVGGGNGVIVLWDWSAGQRRDRLEAQTSRIAGAWLSDDGRMLISGSDNGNDDQVVMVLNLLASDLDMVTFDAGPAKVESMMLGQDESVLVTAGEEGVFVWDLRPASWEPFACARVSRNLSLQEWNDFVLPKADESGRQAPEPYDETCDRYDPGEGAGGGSA